MKKIKIIVLLLFSITKIIAQVAPNNPIFQGGAQDGTDKVSFAQAPNNIFSGGSNDGASNAVFTQTVSNIFVGSAGDGISTTNYLQAPVNIFAGGDSDGWNGTNFAQAPSNIFAGGNSDGWNGMNFAQAGNSIFAGGAGDGWNAMYYKPAVALPVVFVYFKAKKIDKIGEITWQTSSETNAAYYEIQRGTDALKFQTIGTVSSIGNSKEANTYEFLDENPLKTINYYRLKQVDLDGKYTFTPARALNFTELNAATVKYYPNPNQGKLIVELSENWQKEAKIINIFNELGIVVGHQKLAENSNNHVDINMTGLPKGVYFIQIISKSLSSSQKIILN
jgi:Secretion system C-terminal sorting domain